MKPIDAYQQDQSDNWTRIDLLLAAFDGSIERLEKANELLQEDDMDAALPILVRVQNITMQLLSGLDMSQGEIPKNMQVVYIHVLRCIGLGDDYNLDAAIEMLTNVREGLRSIRDEAAELEHSGAILPVAKTASTISLEIG